MLPRSKNQSEGRRKRRAAALSVASNTTLVLGKLLIGMLSGSIAVISEAIHSGMDLLAAVIALIAVSLSDRPPDKEHPFGHGKIENISGAVEALLIFGAVIFIASEAIHKLLHGGEIKLVYLGAAVMAFSALVNTFVSWHLQRVGEQTDSDALLADAAHLRTDVYTSLGVFFGLLLVHLTRIWWLDPLVALSVALLILREAWLITRKSFGGLMDESLPHEERVAIEEIIQKAGMKFHALRSRKSGPNRKIELHLDVNPQATALQVHSMCDQIESDIEKLLPGSQILIHPEPHLPQEDSHSIQNQIIRILEDHRDLPGRVSDLQSHQCADGFYVILRMNVAPHFTIAAAHQMRQRLVEMIKEKLPHVHLALELKPDNDQTDRRSSE